MTAAKTFLSALLMAATIIALPAQAVITINSDEVWDGVANPRAGDGVTLNDGVYTIPDSILIASGATVFLNDPNVVDLSNSITWEFLPASGGLTFADDTSTIDVYAGARNQPSRTFTLNMNDNTVGGSVAGAGQIINGIWVSSASSGDSMSVTINSQTDVAVGTIDVTKSDAQGSSVNINSQGLVDIDLLANADVSAGGGSVPSINITGESLTLGDIDTRAFRDSNGSTANNGNINLRALGQPENSVGNFNANAAAANAITLDGFVNTNAPPAGNAGGSLNVTAVKLTLAATFSTDISENGLFNVNVGTVGNGFVAGDVFVNNSGATPDSLGFTVFHDGTGPDDVEWITDGTGNWYAETNWNPVAIPQANNQTAIFGSGFTAPITVFMDQQPTVKGIRFDNANQVVVGGTSGITLEANSGNGSIEALQGSHVLQKQLTLNSNVDASASAGAQIDLDGVLNLNGNTLNISGAGQVNLNNVATGMGSIVNSGILGTDGQTGISGSLTSTGTIDLDIGGTTLGFFDAFGVSGSASLSGLLSVELTGGFDPANGEAFTVVTAGSLSAAGLSLAGPNAAQFNLIVNSDNIVLQRNATPFIVAVAVPEPASLLLIVLGSTLLRLPRRSQRGSMISQSPSQS